MWLPAAFLLAAVSQPVLRFSLSDTAGTIHTEREWAAARAVVLIFITTDCPISNSYVPELSRIARDYSGRGVVFYAVHSDSSQDGATVRKHVSDFAYSFPVLLDRKLALARAVRATVTPEAAVLTPAGRVVYLGRIDDRVVDFGQVRREARQHDLRKTLDAVLAGKPVAQRRTRAIGCAISFGSL